MNTSQEYAIIVAGGSGTRMQSALPKQFLLLNGMPVLMHTLTAFYNYSKELSIILVLPDKEKNQWAALCEKHSFVVPHQVVSGGASRFQSVKNGLQSIPQSSGLVAIHDGVRPVISKEIIANSFTTAAAKGTAITSVALKDSIRQVEGPKNKSVNRSAFRIIQTPQTFQLNIIKKAFETEEKDFFTDDASVAEAAGFEIVLIEGDYKNIKITTPEDLIVAEAFISKK
ncbi:MAG TPA: 2-C-methyl-D-erythritol 4-phosphate cytidylyltransferase [Cytophagaceae bacterium]